MSSHSIKLIAAVARRVTAATIAVSAGLFVVFSFLVSLPLILFDAFEDWSYHRRRSDPGPRYTLWAALKLRVRVFVADMENP